MIDPIILKTRADALIEAQNTMTLATTASRGAWAAPVYYAHQKSSFYFFSDPASRHIVDSLDTGQAAAAIFAPASSWQDIRGIQMSGDVKTVSAGVEAVAAIAAYLKKFPFTRDFFDSSESLHLNDFTKRFSVKLYRFYPTLMYYLDNSVRFGFRESVTLT
jgi:uncharacterized protein YhbP (UPF0306 family)